MGLDMYLKAKRFYYDEARAQEIINLTMPENHPFKKLRQADVTIEIGYWRKANEIHNWFVNNVQTVRITVLSTGYPKRISSPYLPLSVRYWMIQS